MSFIKRYAKLDNDYYYTAEICRKDAPDECRRIYDNYKLVNAFPEHHHFPFDSTKDNTIIMIPDRVMHDKQGIQKMILDHAKRQSCFDVEPLDQFSSMIFCEKEKEKEQELEYVKPDIDPPVINYRILYILLVGIIISLGITFSIASYLYISERKIAKS
jgi:hypothetical protein